VTTTPGVNQSILDYLKEHRAGVLATQNRSGTPQQTLIGYRFDGNDIAISTRRATLKAKNVSMRPNVSLAVIDGRSQVIVYGKVKIVRDPEQVLSLHRERGLLGDRQTDPQAFAEALRSEDRVVLLLPVERTFPTTLRR
jgi:pyridoxine/pyridoxamine 5'-phosphate oxidase